MYKPDLAKRHENVCALWMVQKLFDVEEIRMGHEDAT